MPFLRKDLLRRYCNDELNVRWGLEALGQFESCVCLILNKAAERCKASGHTVIRGEDIKEVVKHGVDDMSAGERKHTQTNKTEEAR